MSKYTAAIIGLGQVGQGYDYHVLDNSLILTHASALYYHNEFDLIAAVDSSKHQRNRYSKKFSRPVFSNLDDLYSKYNPDVVVIAVSTIDHFAVFQEVLSHNPKAIVLEKPIAESLSDAVQMQKIALNYKTVVSVNYIRRFNPAIIKLKNLINQGALGEIYKGTAWYTKGIAHNGSHFIDLFCWLFGDVEKVTVLSCKRSWSNKDPEPDICLHFKQADIYMFSGHEEEYSISCFDLIGENGMVSYEDGKAIEIRLAYEDPIYDGYQVLQDADNINNPSNINIKYVYDNLANYFSLDAPIPSNITTSIHTLKVVQYIIKQIKKT